MTERTRRQRLVDLLEAHEQSFEGLRVALGVPVRQLEDDLRHVERSAKQQGATLAVTPAECESCGYVFRDRGRYITPGRCPKCRGERIQDAVFALETQ